MLLLLLIMPVHLRAAQNPAITITPSAPPPSGASTHTTKSSAAPPPSPPPTSGSSSYAPPHPPLGYIAACTRGKTCEA